MTNQENIAKSEELKKHGNKKLSKIMTLALCGTLAFSMLTGCANTDQPEGGGSSMGGGSMGGGVQVPNPWAICETLTVAEESAGFEMVLPESIEEEDMAIKAMKDSMIDVEFTSGDDKISVRKGTASDSISGNFTVYDDVEEVETDGITVTTKGAEDLIYVATWNVGDYSFAINAVDGVDLETLTNLVKTVK